MKKIIAPDVFKAVSFWMLTAATVLTMPGVYDQIVTLFPEWERYVLPAILLARVIKQASGNGQV